MTLRVTLWAGVSLSFSTSILLGKNKHQMPWKTFGRVGQAAETFRDSKKLKSKENLCDKAEAYIVTNNIINSQYLQAQMTGNVE